MPRSSKIYWSIDLDYWMKLTPIFPREVFDEILSWQVPIHIVTDHHHLLKYLRKTEFDVLVNSDHHSDLAENLIHGKKCGLNEGTWGNFVIGRKNKKFIWHYPLKMCLSQKSNGGYCHCYKNPFTRYNKYDPKICEWKDVVKRQEFMPRENDGHIVAVGISISSEWTKYTTIEDFTEWCEIAAKEPQVYYPNNLFSVLDKIINPMVRFRKGRNKSPIF